MGPQYFPVQDIKQDVTRQAGSGSGSGNPLVMVTIAMKKHDDHSNT